MKNPILDQIKKATLATFTQRYGYCGLADTDNFALLNSGGESESFLVTIQDDDPKLKARRVKVSELDESDRQAVLLAIAELSLSRPGWKFMLTRIAAKLEGVQTFEGFRETSRDRIKPVSLGME